ncbi:hypothetical protein [Synechococcus sp. CC9616]|uniref:hypothetical protein n=1 Tax=Synechococcus sp. CC9616 TaxID=110663 RepID=UPI00048E32E3|nr:hypothetical protein [Synechococcus sp. CC9616]
MKNFQKDLSFSIQLLHLQEQNANRTAKATAAASTPHAKPSHKDHLLIHQPERLMDGSVELHQAQLHKKPGTTQGQASYNNSNN